MSVIIPNMKMPMSCLACPLAREMFGCLVCVGYFKDSLTGRRVYKSDLKESDADFNRPDWCPILPLPEGHGRLIDADAFKAMCLSATKEAKLDFIRHEDWLKSCAITMSFCRDIDEQPTIVPAEGGTDDG